MMVCLCLSVAHAQANCGQVQTQAVGRVQSLRNELSKIPVAEDGMGSEVPDVAQRLLPALKAGLSDTAVAVLSCMDVNTPQRSIEETLAQLLHANPPQPPPNTSVMNGDPRYTEWENFNYGRNLLVSVKSRTPSLLSVEFTFHIPCGDDRVLLLFEAENTKWVEKLRWQAQPYKEISGAFGDIFESAIVQEKGSKDWKLVVVHGEPWCSSRLSGFNIDVLAPQEADVNPRAIWHTNRLYSRGDFVPSLTASGDIFEFRVHEDEMVFDENAFERTAIYRYRVSENGVTRLEPIATTGRGFVEEWLSMPWKEALEQSSNSGADGLQRMHTVYEQSYKGNANEYTSWAAGPVRSCKARGHFKVAFDEQQNIIVPGKPGGDQGPEVPYYFQIVQVDNGYQMVSVSKAPDASCSGPDLMKKSK